MAKIDWVERRLQNWVRWKISSGGMGALGFASVQLGDSINGGRDRSGYVSAAIPISGIEASDTDEAVLALPGELKATVQCMYLGSGTLREKLAWLCCGETTMRERLTRAHRQLAEYFNAVDARRRAERARVEALQVRSSARGFTP